MLLPIPCCHGASFRPAGARIGLHPVGPRGDSLFPATDKSSGVGGNGRHRGTLPVGHPPPKRAAGGTACAAMLVTFYVKNANCAFWHDFLRLVHFRILCVFCICRMLCIHVLSGALICWHCLLLYFIYTILCFGIFCIFMQILHILHVLHILHISHISHIFTFYLGLSLLFLSSTSSQRTTDSPATCYVHFILYSSLV